MSFLGAFRRLILYFEPKKRRQSPAALGAQLLSDALLAAQLAPATAGAIFLHLEPPRAGKSAGELQKHF